MNIFRLKYFTEAARCNSFSEAAKRLYTTQPNISKQIGLMENELGLKLFKRTNRSVKLTKAGQYIYDELCDIPDKIEQTFATARKLASAEKSTITIGSFMLPQISHAINLAIRTFGETNPDTICELEHQGYAGLRQGLEAGDFDLIMLPVFDIPLLKCEVCSKTLMRIPASIAVRANHPLAERSDLKLIDFKDCDFILTSPEESSAGYNSIIKLCEDRGFTPHIGRTVKTLDTLLLAVELGNGVALVDSTLTLAPYSPIKLVPLNDDIFSDIAVVWRADADTKNLEGMVNALSSAFEL